jgi:arylsulfatase A-like enzyme
MSKPALVLLCLLAACAPGSSGSPASPGVPPAAPPPPDRGVVIVVWDGLRPDGVTAADTPNLVRLRDGGVEFTDNHATYPTFTMMNAASFATGAFADATGFYGNVLWQPGATGSDSAGKPVDFRQPVFSEDYAVLDALKAPNRQMFPIETLFEAAQAAGMVTLAIGKSGAAYAQDTGRGGLVLDEKAALPLALAKQLQAAGVALPPTAPKAFAAGELALAPDNGNPVEFRPIKRLDDGASSDPSDEAGSPYKGAVDFLVNAYLEHVLPDRHPRLTVLWLRDPDTTEHQFGIGTPNWHDAMRANDQVLGRLIARLEALGLRDRTDVVVVSDHGHSNVSGPFALFPLRAVKDGAVGELDPRGHSVSGMVRIADVLRRAGFAAFDGLGCTLHPVGLGVRKDGTPVYPVLTDAGGTLCGKQGQKYQAAPYKVPAQLPAHAIIVAVNGGSDYLYVPDHDPALVKKTVGFLQSRAEVGAIFIDDRYGAVPGTLPLGAIHARNAAGKNPDIIFSYDHDETAVIEGMRGTEMAGILGGGNFRGMHGSFSPLDVHNVLIATGPDFRAGWKDPLPTGNVDLAPTVARILGLALPHAQGRPLLEALVRGAAAGDYRVASHVERPAAPATGLTVHLPTDPDGKDVAPGVGTYSFELHTKSLSHGAQSWTYYDFAKASRR